jgi:hypothetical protein
MAQKGGNTVARASSGDFSENTAEPRPGDYGFLMLACELLLKGLPQNMMQYKALGYRLGMSGRGKPYDPYYIKYVMEGKTPLYKQIQRAAEKLVSELRAEPPDSSGYKTVMIKVPNGVEIPNGAIVLKEARVCICGKFFIPTIWNQVNHTTACAKMRARLRRRK